MPSNGFLILVWVVFVHLAGLYLFTNGFLLRRLTLNDVSVGPSLLPTHQRTIFLIIDALRFDFVSDLPPEPISPYYHNVLTIPRDLTAKYPQHSFLFNAYADPPTTTLQRIKALTTGSLPTFVDTGSNFGGYSILEDSLIQQLGSAGKKIAFMGDDTWLSVYPDSFQENLTFPYDSFNVEDLHSVDNGVIRHLFPLMRDSTRPFDFLIGHFLGVDHVGHRVGPEHQYMKTKLSQMNDVLGEVVELLDEDTLLVVIGDHGMDRSGDHGGDGELETSAAAWIYSKGRPLSLFPSIIPSEQLPTTTFPGSSARHRSIKQIDLLPSISLLLGLPIPFNNLGSIIPELFAQDADGTMLGQALHLNSEQIHGYMSTYKSSPSGNELDPFWERLESIWGTASVGKDEDTPLARFLYNRAALDACISVWARFNPVLMGFGLTLLGAGVLASLSIYRGIKDRNDWDIWLDSRLQKCVRGIAAGSIFGVLLSISWVDNLQGVDALDCVIFLGPFISCITILMSSPTPVTIPKDLHVSSLSILLVFHAVAFFSNSFTFWEDRIILFLLNSSLLPSILIGVAAPTARLRLRILAFSGSFLLCARLISISTVCREEQQPYCDVTFYASSSSPPFLALLLALPFAAAIPFVMKYILKFSLSHNGLASFFLPFIATPTLMAGATFWYIEWADSANILDDGWSTLLRTSRTLLAWSAFVVVVVLGGALWWVAPLCLKFDAEKATGGTTTQVKVLGFANTFGSSYLMFWTIAFVLIFSTTQLAGQVVLGLSVLCLLSLLEVIDSVRDVESLNAALESNPSALLDSDTRTRSTSPSAAFSEVVPLALLGLLVFYGTGHQSTLPSVQWKSGFILASNMEFATSAFTVALNTLGPLFLVGLAAPLIGLWNQAPNTRKAGGTVRLDRDIRAQSVLASLSIMTYYLTLLFTAAAGAAILRRHLMVWKVFAPRFLAAGLGSVAVDVGVLLGMGVGVERIAKKTNQVFQSALLSGPRDAVSNTK